MDMQNIVDVRRQLLVYEDTPEAWQANRIVLDYEGRLQTLGTLKIKEYRVLINRLEDASHQLKQGRHPKQSDFTSTLAIDEEDETPFQLTEDGIRRKIGQLDSRIQELRELLRIPSSL